MDLNTWYEVTKKFTDSYGYSLGAGWSVSFTQDTYYTSDRKALYYIFFDSKDKRYQANGCLIISSTERAAMEEVLKPLGKKAVAELEKQVLESRKDHPDQHCDMSASVYVGSDPEVFVTTKKGDLIPAWEFLKAQDKKKKVAPRASMYGQEPSSQPDPYWDGFQAEFQIIPQQCHAYVTDNIQAQLQRLHTLATAYKTGAKIDATPVMAVPKAMLIEAAPEYVALGCMPSLNAYGMQGEKPADGRELPFRFAGFHVHHAVTSYQPSRYTESAKKPIKDPVALVRSIDNIAGIMSVSVLEGLENPVRRQYYGLAGEYRTPAHGLEYRVLSSAALWHPALTHLHLDFARAGMQLAVAGLDTLWDGSSEETIDIINRLDVGQARVALKRNRRLVEGLLERYYGAKWSLYGDTNKAAKPAAIFDALLMKGIAQYIELDVEKNWVLTGKEWVSHTEGAGCQMHKFASENFKTKIQVAKAE